jgi:hypothetical protein
MESTRGLLTFGAKIIAKLGKFILFLEDCEAISRRKENKYFKTNFFSADKFRTCSLIARNFSEVVCPEKNQKHFFFSIFHRPTILTARSKNSKAINGSGISRKNCLKTLVTV